MQSPIAIEPVWYRQFWPWFLIALPSVAVIACLYSLGIAIRHSDDSVREEYLKEGLAIQPSIASADAASQQQLSAALTIDVDGRIDLDLRGRFATQPQVLILEFIHPFDRHNDLPIELRAAGGTSYRGLLAQRPDGRWRIELRQPGERWRLSATVAIAARQTLQISL